MKQIKATLKDGAKVHIVKIQAVGKEYLVFYFTDMGGSLGCRPLSDFEKVGRDA